jgi:hypothetical protein
MAESVAVTVDRADDPITLAEACKLFPKARLTPSTLRAERNRGRLNIFPLGRRDYTTEADMRAWVKSSRDKNRHRVSNSMNAENSDVAKTAALITLRRLASGNQDDGGRKRSPAS